ncbi:MAG TPA: hypothetical protein VHW44_17275 [Pseudonocardiaceae bacterium]|jgi:hypothetical protein|nr:hypothetical protein [Pseudonocardiaceae bacterium]
METLIGFVVGYLVGTRQGREGLQKVREAVEGIRNSPETRQLVLTGVAVGRSAVGQVLSGGAGALFSGAVEAITHKVDTLNSDSDRAA